MIDVKRNDLNPGIAIFREPVAWRESKRLRPIPVMVLFMRAGGALVCDCSGVRLHKQRGGRQFHDDRPYST